MSSNYRNIDQPTTQNRPTEFMLPFEMIIGSDTTIHRLPLRTIKPTYISADMKLSHTSIQIEIPDALDETDTIFPEYFNCTYVFDKDNWSLIPPIGAPVAHKFKTKTPFIIKSLKIYMDMATSGGPQYEEWYIINNFPPETISSDIIELSASIYNTYKPFYVTYIPADIELFNGDNIEHIKSSYNVVPSYNPLTLKHEYIKRARDIINNIEEYFIVSGFPYPPSLWVGGTDNQYKSSANNILEDTTPYNLIHLKELHNSIFAIEQFINSTLNIIYPITDFNNIISDIDYLEIITRAINDIELKLASVNI